MGTSTDIKGEFAIEKVPVGRCNISVSMIGFTPYVANNLLVYSGKETMLDIVLEETINELAEVTITAKVDKEQPLNKMAVVSARMLSSEEANRYAGSWGDPARMAANLAGVAAANDSRNDIVIRGNSPMGLLWKLDGFEIPNPNHFGSMGGTGGPVGMLNNNQLANSDFYTGAFPAEFGNVTSGVFDLRLRNGNNRRHEFLASMGFNGAELGAEGPLNKKTGASYLINGRYSFLSILESFGIKFTPEGGAVPEYQDLCAKINWPLQKGNLSLITLWGNNRIHSRSDMSDESEWQAGDKGTDYNWKGKQTFLGLNYTYRFTTRTRLENRFSYQYYRSDIMQDKIAFPNSEIVPGEGIEGTSTEERFSYMAVMHHRPNSKNFISGGAGLDFFITDLNNIHHEITLNDSRDNSSLVRAFLQWQYRISDDLVVTPGIHSQFYTFNNDYSIEPRIGLKWTLSPRSAASLGGGLYSQLQPRQVYFYKEENKLVNHDLEMSRSWQCVSGYDLKIGTDVRLKTEVYYQYLFNIPVIPEIPQQSLLNLGDDFYNNWDYVFVNKGIGTNYGIDLTLEKFFSHQYYFLLTASLYDSRYKGYDNVSRNSKFAGNYALNTLFGYEWKIGKTDLLSINFKIAYMGGKRYLPAYTEYEGEETEYDYTHAYTEHLPDYFRCDLNLNMKNNFKRFAVEWFIEVNNLTNHKNIWTKYYNNSRKSEEYIYQYTIMPIGGCKIYFNTK